MEQSTTILNEAKPQSTTILNEAKCSNCVITYGSILL
jgi:hypothetical protein